MRARSLVVLLVGLVLTPAIVARAGATVEAGKKVYEQHCVQCHGEKGDGEGPAAVHLSPRPRDFTSGKFKLRTTPSGALPTDEDLKRVVRLGMPYSSMPPWPKLTDAEVDGVVQYLKTFYAGFADPAQAPKPIALGAAPTSTKESVAKGKELYSSLGCIRCHGEAGRGEGPSAPTLKDDLNHPIRAADLTRRWTFRGGPKREDIFRTFSTGLNGTPMPSFFDAVTEPDRWALTDYVYSLGDADVPNYATLIVARPLEDDIDPAKGASLFAGAASARLPVIGQIMEPGRAFAPAANAVEVRAVYDAQRIAFEVRWHDMRADTAATNSPTLEVPLADEELTTPAAAEPAGATDIWGEPQAPAAAAPKAGAGAGGDFWGETPAAGAGAEGGAPGAEFSDAVAIQLPATASRGRRQALLPVRRRVEARRPLVPGPRLDSACTRTRAAARRASRRSRAARSRAAATTRPASGPRASCAACAPPTACRSPRASTFPWRSRSGTAPRASAATAAASRSGSTSTCRRARSPRSSFRC